MRMEALVLPALLQHLRAKRHASCRDVAWMSPPEGWKKLDGKETVNA